MIRPWLRCSVLWWCLVAGSANADPVAAAAQAIVQRHGDADVLVLGELHGTREAPAVLAALAGTLGSRGALQIGLEIPRAEQARLDAWLGSDGGEAARATLLAGAFWQRPAARSDGRRSVAMGQLLEHLRRLRHEHPALGVLAIDPGKSVPGERERDMAEALRAAHARAPATRLLVLVGNYHARLDPPQSATVNGVPYTPPPPMAGYLRDLHLATVDLGARSGAFWGCQGACGEQSLPILAPRDETLQVAPLDPQHDGYHLRLRLPRYSVSPPLVP